MEDAELLDDHGAAYERDMLERDRLRHTETLAKVSAPCISVLKNSHACDCIHEASCSCQALVCRLQHIFIDAVEEGRVVTVQAGFDIGFASGSRIGIVLGQLRGLLRAIVALEARLSTKHEPADESTTLTSLLIEADVVLCRSLLRFRPLPAPPAIVDAAVAAHQRESPAESDEAGHCSSGACDSAHAGSCCSAPASGKGADDSKSAGKANKCHCSSGPTNRDNFCMSIAAAAADPAAWAAIRSCCGLVVRALSVQTKLLANRGGRTAAAGAGGESAIAASSATAGGAASAETEDAEWHRSAFVGHPLQVLAQRIITGALAIAAALEAGTSASEADGDGDGEDVTNFETASGRRRGTDTDTGTGTSSGSGDPDAHALL